MRKRPFNARAAHILQRNLLNARGARPGRTPSGNLVNPPGYSPPRGPGPVRDAVRGPAGTKPPAFNKVPSVASTQVAPLGPKNVDQAHNRETAFGRRYDVGPTVTGQERSSRRQLVRSLVGNDRSALHKAQGVSGANLAGLVANRRSLRDQLGLSANGRQEKRALAPGQEEALQDRLAQIREALVPVLQQRRSYLEQVFTGRNKSLGNRTARDAFSSRRNQVGGNRLVSGRAQQLDPGFYRDRRKR